MALSKRRVMPETDRKPQTKYKTGHLLKIGEVSKRSGLGIETLRFYERSGLLDRPARTEGGYRLYAPEVLDRLDFIKRAQVLGFALGEIAQIISDRRAGKSPCAEVREIIRHRLQEMDERLAEMRRYRRELGAALAEWDRTGELEGEICGLIESTEIAPVKSARRKLIKEKR